MELLESVQSGDYQYIVDEICCFAWSGLTSAELLNVAQAYYYYSIQFRENLEIACQLHPADCRLHQLLREECDTDNLSPYPGVAHPGERMDHDEFMRRLVAIGSDDRNARIGVYRLGHSYLEAVRSFDPTTRAMSIASYEDGGLERVFRAILQARDWNEPALRAFRHFLIEHIKFDSDPENGHGALSRHLVPDARIVPLWQAFRDLLLGAAPSLATRNPGYQSAIAT